MYLGTYLDDRGYQDVLTKIVHEAGIEVPWQMPPGCEATRLGDITFLFNHTSEDRMVWIPRDMVSVGEVAVQAGPVTLPPNHVMVLRDAH